MGTRSEVPVVLAEAMGTNHCVLTVRGGNRDDFGSPCSSRVDGRRSLEPYSVLSSCVMLNVYMHQK